MMVDNNLTPIRKQYLQIKNQYPNVIIFFRLGDFYETFDHDAEITSRELDIVLTSRNVAKGQRVPMAGIPFHAANNYISRLINKGYHVAICEQIGEQPTKGLFKRKVVRVITPGAILDSELIKNEKNNYLVCVYSDPTGFGISFMDISTGEWMVTQFSDTDSKNKILAELSRISPTEVLLPESLQDFSSDSYFITRLPDWKYEQGRCEQLLLNHLNVASLEGFGLKNKHMAVSAAGCILDYIYENEPSAKPLLNSPKFYLTNEFMLLDEQTRRNLELSDSLRSNATKASLLNVIDKTVTPMGKRLIGNWINQPLIDIKSISKRHDAVEFFVNNGIKRTEAQELLKKFSDIDRIINRVISMHTNPRELVSLKNSFRNLPDLPNIINPMQFNDISSSDSSFYDCKAEYILLDGALIDDPPANLQHTGIFRKGYSSDLDHIIKSSSNSREWIANLEKREKARTGIKTLKVGYNKVFGYYIEISRSYLEKIPPEYIRKQTLLNGERFITPELKDYETLVLNAEEQIKEIEQRLFDELCQKLASSADQILNVSKLIAELDVLLAFAQIAVENRYIRPVMYEDTHLIIRDGRHPVVEITQPNISFIPNDAIFDDDKKIHVVTGPNMSGKSTYLRQIALIVLLAQIGSFVPADYAEIGIVDRIFTRIGAQDEISAGQSTFMVEMIETANILNNATIRSLLILDEIGRGTSTYDGLSMAWAILENIHNNPKINSRTLFATHFHELTQMAEIFPRISNFSVAVSEIDGKIIFLHKIIEGGADRSYGIHVAQLAGIPPSVIKRAYELLNKFESENGNTNILVKPTKTMQIPLFKTDHPLIKELTGLDLNSLSPLEALNKLYDWKNRFIQ